MTVKEVSVIIDQALVIQTQMNEPHEAPEVQVPFRTLPCHLCGERYEAQEMRGINTCATCHGLSRDYIQQLKKKRAESISPQEALARSVAGDDDIDKARESLERVREAPG